MKSHSLRVAQVNSPLRIKGELLRDERKLTNGNSSPRLIGYLATELPEPGEGESYSCPSFFGKVELYAGQLK